MVKCTLTINKYIKKICYNCYLYVYIDVFIEYYSSIDSFHQLTYNKILMVTKWLDKLIIRELIFIFHLI